MVNKRERGRKEITQEMVDSFSSILDELDDIEPEGKKKKNTASSLIRENSEKIKSLLKRGYSAEQIIGQLSKIGLDLAPETLKTVVRNTDSKGKAITGKSKKKAKRKITTFIREANRSNIESVADANMALASVANQAYSFNITNINAVLVAAIAANRTRTS